MTTNGDERTVALGNRLKELRNKHNLTISGLAEILGISHSYVGFLEKGTRKGSPEILKKYADFFQVSLEELLELQSHVIDTDQAPLNSYQMTDKIVELNSLLSKLNENVQSLLIEKFKEQVQQTLYSFITAYDVSEVKRKVTLLKNTWFSSNSEFEEKQIETELGYINLPSGNLYFRFQFDESMLHLQLLYEDRKQLSLFENWLNQPSISYQTNENIQHIDEPQKILNVIWLSPKLSYEQQYHILNQKNLLSLELNFSDTKLEWYVSNFQRYNSMQDDTVS